MPAGDSGLYLLGWKILEEMAAHSERADEDNLMVEEPGRV